MLKYFILLLSFFPLKILIAQNFNESGGLPNENVANPYNSNSIIASYKGFGSFDGSPTWISINGSVLLTNNFVFSLGYKSYSVGYYSDKEIGLSSNYSFNLNKDWKLSLGVGIDWLQAKMDFVSMYQQYPVIGIPSQNEKYSGLAFRAAFVLTSKSWFFGFDGKHLLTEFNESEKNIASVDNKQNFEFQFIAGKKFVLVPTVLDLQAHIATEFSDIELFRNSKTIPLQGGLFLDVYQRINVGIYGKYPEGMGMKIYAKNDVIGLFYIYFADMRIGFSNPGHQIGLVFMLDHDKKRPLLRIDRY